ncbi:MAG: acyl-CoA thioesterase [Nocardioides sp.]|uniref:acyl-CoA thioesterase n=1 Tax=Nocardioides sp. TaxID=35761 RepID=UPI0039E3502B
MSGSETRAARPASFSRVALNQVMRRAQENLYGVTHGGEILKLADTAAGAASFRHCGGRTVTRSVESAEFAAPVELGSLVHATATVVSAGRTSLRVEVVVEKEPLYALSPGEREAVGTVVFVMVHLDPDGRPAPVPGVASQE